MKLALDVLGSAACAGLAYVGSVYWPFKCGAATGAVLAGVVFIVGIVSDTLSNRRKKSVAEE